MWGEGLEQKTARGGGCRERVGWEGVHRGKEMKEPNPYHPVRSQWQDPQGIPHQGRSRGGNKNTLARNEEITKPAQSIQSGSLWEGRIFFRENKVRSCYFSQQAL